MAHCSWLARECKVCKLSPWPTRTKASPLYYSTPRLLMANRFYCPATRWCSKVSTNIYSIVCTYGTHIVGLATPVVILCGRCGGRNASLSDSLLFLIDASDRCHDIPRHQLPGQERWPTNEERDTPRKEQVEWKRIRLFSEIKLVGNITLWWFSNKFNAIICSRWIDVVYQLIVTTISVWFKSLCREAARECRRKKKEYVKCLENRVAVLENQNKTLIEELKTLKDLYCVKSG